MTAQELEQLDSRLFMVHSLLTMLMQKPAGAPLTPQEITALDAAEKTLGVARDLVVRDRQAVTRPSIPFTSDDPDKIVYGWDSPTFY